MRGDLGNRISFRIFMAMILETLQQFVNEMQATSSSLDKVEILKKYKDIPNFQALLKATYDPYFQYYVTSKSCLKHRDMAAEPNGEITEESIIFILDALLAHQISGHEAIKCINGFINYFPQYENLIYNIIDKDLKIRTGAKVINKAIPGLIPEFNVALAQEYKHDIDFWFDDMYVSRKLDGVRCLAIVDDDGECKLYSRQGKEFLTLGKVKEAIELLNITNTVFDGEICLTDVNGDEDFQGIMKQIRRKDHTIHNPKYIIFDHLTKEEFELNTTSPLLEERYERLSETIPEQNDVLYQLDQQKLYKPEDFDEWVDRSNTGKWEGLMLRRNVIYEGKRTKNLLKVKKFHDAEYKVIDVNFGDMSVVREGKEIQENMLAQVWIEHKGHKVKVGSGFNQEQRIKYKKESIIGKTITVQYFEETKNQEGGISLRFPTLKVIHGDERTT